MKYFTKKKTRAYADTASIPIPLIYYENEMPELRPVFYRVNFNRAKHPRQSN